ncbi:hypothetical protein EVAR_99782_1 [Eumeta japonica]|uniref:Uncharacterized protein n=1 Tax=Eumeta variegata TaxID=151549 RepID=A0A4C1ZMN7_EUMVA|nr:hypothetical protein EVAR_99782_1 [Eumeta japonica]
MKLNLKFLIILDHALFASEETQPVVGVARKLGYGDNGYYWRSTRTGLAWSLLLSKRSVSGKTKLKKRGNRSVTLPKVVVDTFFWRKTPPQPRPPSYCAGNGIKQLAERLKHRFSTRSQELCRNSAPTWRPRPSAVLIPHG